jgi:chemotaxis protein methyltransferase CheR
MNPPSPIRLLRQAKRHLQYRYQLRFQPRQNRIYSQFNRFPNQSRALVERVLPALLERDPSLKSRALEIAVFACCSGEEVYTLAHNLRKHFPKQAYRIRGYDLVPEVVEQAREGKYTREHVTSSPFMTDDLASQLFDIEGDTCTIKPELVEHVSFEVGDLTDAPALAAMAKCDLLFAQNVLFHLPVDVAPAVFSSLCELLRPGGTLFVNGMDTDMRVKLSKQHHLEPVEYLIEEIHEDARVDRGGAWAGQYWGRRPFSKRSRNWMREFGTIFTKEH